MALEFAFIGTGLGLGLRHGVDWDHIAAITDVTGTQPQRLKAFGLGTLYALGHASVVSLLGFLAVLVGTTLPGWLDTYMEMLVGITLVTLGVWVFYSLLHDPHNFRLRSRWMLLFRAVRNAYRWTRDRVTGHRHQYAPDPGPQTYSVGAAYGIGMIHGIGAETGTQVLLFASAAGAGSNLTASLLLIGFVVGLVLSNSAIIAGSILGFWGAGTRRRIYIALGVVTGVFSLGLGTLFLLARGSVLPTIIS
ncbi:MAG: hypothetical protein ACE5IZ_03580 [Dehalococcoidia bacterium]